MYRKYKQNSIIKKRGIKVNNIEITYTPQHASTRFIIILNNDVIIHSHDANSLSKSQRENIIRNRKNAFFRKNNSTEPYLNMVSKRVGKTDIFMTMGMIFIPNSLERISDTEYVIRAPLDTGDIMTYILDFETLEAYIP